MAEKIKILILGASGMLGHAAMKFFAASPGFDVVGSARSQLPAAFPEALRSQVIHAVDVENPDSLAGVLKEVRPEVVINCVGLVKQLAIGDDPLAAIPINSVLPHRLARFCQLVGARLVHVSTDCVYSGSRGRYRESDPPDAQDLYGRSKLLGEVAYPHAVTLRTSIVGPELASAHGLVGWFLAQRGTVRGFTKAIFSGLPTVELARVIRDHVIPHVNLHGVYHVSAEPIDKHELLKLVARTYGVATQITPDDKLVIDRSLDSTRFRAATGFTPTDWPELVRRMHEFG